MNAPEIAIKPGDVTEIDIDSGVFSVMWEYINKRKNRAGWRSRIAELTTNFDNRKFVPLYYCCRHRRFEDGTHRLHVAKLRSDRTILVMGHEGCHERRLPILPTLLELIGKHPESGPKDAAWLAACHGKKWVHLYRSVDYKGRTVLDIGSQSGYICFAAIKAGASLAVGIDVRESMVDLARKAAKIFEFNSSIYFETADWLAISPTFSKRYDIVHCLGTAHYFPASKYRDAIAALAEAAREILVLELRLAPGLGSKLTRRGKQTLPTHSWLRALLNGAGFSVERAFPIVGDKRQMWISRRTN